MWAKSCVVSLLLWNDGSQQQQNLGIRHGRWLIWGKHIEMKSILIPWPLQLWERQGEQNAVRLGLHKQQVVFAANRNLLEVLKETFIWYPQPDSSKRSASGFIRPLCSFDNVNYTICRISPAPRANFRNPVLSLFARVSPRRSRDWDLSCLASLFVPFIPSMFLWSGNQRRVNLEIAPWMFSKVLHYPTHKL